MLPDLYRLSTLFDCTNLCAGINTHSNVITKVPHQVEEDREMTCLQFLLTIKQISWLHRIESRKYTLKALKLLKEQY